MGGVSSAVQIYASVFGVIGIVIALWCLFGYCYYRKYKIKLIEYKQKEDNCFINVICCLPVLFWASGRIYCQPLLNVLCLRCLEKVCCYYCRNNKPEWYYFTDKAFPPNNKSLGINDNKKKITWIRANNLKIDKTDDEQKDIEIKTDDISYPTLDKQNEQKDKEKDQSNSKSSMKLFSDGIEPSDVCQGAIGDCWLIAAIAALAEYPGTIENCFKTYEKQEIGKYVVYLYDARIKDIKKRRKKIVIDDYIPCDTNTNQPIYSKPNGSEMWVLLLEKAFAKFVGSYNNLDGGQTIYALQSITGDNVFVLKYEKLKDMWSKYDVVVKSKHLSSNPFDDWFMTDSNERYDSIRLFKIIQKYYTSGGLITCAITSDIGENVSSSLGIVAGHAYSILKIMEFKKYDKLKLLQLRNPWGTFEWKGKWSKKSNEWNKYNDIAIKLNHTANDSNVDDGVFWIEWNDFLKLYNRIYICDKSSIKNLHIDVMEDEGFWGIFKGCCIGCFQFWCCCRGLIEIYFGRVSSKETVKVNKCCSCCFKDDGHAWTAI